MNLRMRKIWLWTKLVVILAVVVWVVLFFVQNASHTAPVWLFFGVTTRPISLDVIVPITALTAILIYYVVRKIASVMGQLGQVRDQEQREQRERKMEDLARQVDEKMKATESPRKPGP